MPDKNLATLFQNRAYRFSDRPGILYKRGQDWISLTWDEIARKAELIGRGLVALGIEPGDRVALFSRNRPEWIASDLALLSIGAVCVPVNPAWTAVQVRHVLKHSESKAAFVSSGETETTLAGMRPELPGLAHVILLDESNSFPASPATLSLTDLERKGVLVPSIRFYDLLEGVAADGLSSLSYTSGTTGDLKGAMLTHANILSNAVATAEVLSLSEEDSCLSVLPLSHPLERTAGFFSMLHAGATLAYSIDPGRFVRDLAEVKPTVLIGTPQVLETIRTQILEEFRAKPKWVQYFFRKATNRPLTSSSRPPSKALNKIHDRAFFHRIRERLGGRLRFMICGGAFLDPNTELFFRTLGLEVLITYSLTEASPVVSMNPPHFHKAGTSGLPLPGVQVRIASDGEVLVRGANVMKGYYRNPEATREVVNPEGFLRTGDVGLLDSEGYLTLMNRKPTSASTGS